MNAPTPSSPPSASRMAAFHQGTRRRAVMLVAWLEAVLFCGGTFTTYLLPMRHDFEWMTFLVMGVLCLFLSLRLMAAQKSGDETSEALLSVVLISIGGIGFLQRIWFAYHGPMLDDADVYVFRPILAFMPFIALAAVTLTRARVGMLSMWTLWALSTLIVLTGVFSHAGMDLHRDGVAVMMLWLLMAMPVYLLLLSTIPPYEDVLKMSRAELEQATANALIAEQLRISEHRFRMAVKGLQVGVWEHTLPMDDRPGRWWCSDRFFQLLGYSPDELTLTSKNLLDLIDEKHRVQISDLASRSLKDDDGFSMDIQIRVKSRRYRTFNVMAHWERDGSGKPFRLTGAISDVHDRISAEEALRSAKTELQRLAYSDALTDVSNRRSFDERLSIEAARTRRTGSPLSLLIIDLDHFKLYNDHYGHLSGDESLRVVSTLLQSIIHRPADLLARIGGEEFAVLLPDTPQEGAVAIADKMIKGVRDLNLTHEHSPYGVITCSIGIATATNLEITENVLFEAADQALYQAKKNRNEARTRLLPAGPA